MTANGPAADGPTRIRRLPETLVDQIAAGEVVERPASVLKELVENALDAGARRIEIDVDGGGLLRIVVADDGTGMTPEEAGLSVERHATSKITDAADLLRVGTYGFRGEALPSIGSVAHLDLLTSTGGLAGTRVVVDGGRKEGPMPAARPRGTTVTVSDLFANVPARRKFLRTADSERRRAVLEVRALAMPRPDVSFLLRADGRAVLDLPAAEAVARAEEAAGGAKSLGGMLEFRGGRHGIVVRGFASTALFPTRRSQWIFVRNRWIEDRAISRAVARAEEDAFSTNLRHPALVLFVDVPPESVDVNVHPAKSEVRFRDSSAVFEAVQSTLRDALPRVKAAAPSRGALGGRLLSTPPADEAGRGDGPPAPIATAASGPARQTAFTLSEALPAASLSGTPRQAPASGARYLGQHASTFLLVEQEGELLLVDQHAAHERILFEAALARLAGSGLPSQRLLEPVLFEPSLPERELLEERGADLARAGFELAELSGGSWGLSAVPEILKGDALALLRELAGGDDTLPDDAAGAADPLFRALAARLACRAAVMKGDPVGPLEARRLVEDLFLADDPTTCAHGRPTFVALSKDELERRFGRRGRVPVTTPRG